MCDLLKFPIFYNLRFLVAGNQQLTKNFITGNFKKYNCKTVVDIGCGTGDFCLLFNPEEYTGIDINSEYIKYAKRKYSYRFIEGNISTNHIKRQKFDAAILVSTLHHLSDFEAKNIFKNLLNIINKIVIIIDLNPETSIIKKLLITLDRGNFVRTTKEKTNLLSPFGKIIKISHFSTRLASQSGIILTLSK